MIQAAFRSIARLLAVTSVLLALSPASWAERPRLPNPWKELFRPNCAGDDCQAADYAEHKRRLKQQQRQRAAEERAAAKQRQKEACKKQGGSGTAHTTPQC